MDYSDLVTAVKDDESHRLNEMIEALRPRLISFLRIHMNASRDDAEDCAHESLVNSFEAIHSGRIQNPEHIVSYLFTSCRNNYLNMKKKRREDAMDDIPEPASSDPGQLESILDSERRKILKWCVDQLKESQQQFIEYWFTNPEAPAESVADEFGISVSNAWTKKHRIKEQLTECLQEKSNL